MNDMEMIDVSESTNKDVKKKDKFMTYIYISLVILVVLGLLTYFFGYDLLKPFIEKLSWFMQQDEMMVGRQYLSFDEALYLTGRVG